MIESTYRLSARWMGKEYKSSWHCHLEDAIEEAKEHERFLINALNEHKLGMYSAMEIELYIIAEENGVQVAKKHPLYGLEVAIRKMPSRDKILAERLARKQAKVIWMDEEE